jgi:hypothetical protein
MLPFFGVDCGRRPPTPDALLPPELAGSWKRRDIHELPPESVPPQTARGSLQRAFEADYEGPAGVQVDLFELASPASALDLAQRWRPAADTVFFYQGPYFSIVRWQTFDRQNVAAFVRAFEQHLRALGGPPQATR